jgi:hypothetical protein
MHTLTEVARYFPRSILWGVRSMVMSSGSPTSGNPSLTYASKPLAKKMTIRNTAPIMISGFFMVIQKVGWFDVKYLKK